VITPVKYGENTLYRKLSDQRKGSHYLKEASQSVFQQPMSLEGEILKNARVPRTNSGRGSDG